MSDYEPRRAGQSGYPSSGEAQADRPDDGFDPVLDTAREDAGTPPPAPETGHRATGGRAIVSGAAWQALGQFAPLLINLILTPFILSGLGQEVYGLFLLVMSGQMFIAALDGGLSASSARYFSILAGRGDKAGMTRLLTTVLAMATVTSTIIVVGIFILAPTIMGWFPDTAVDPSGAVFLLRSMAVIIGISQLRSAFQQVVWAHGTFAWNSLSTILGHVIYVAGMVGTIHWHWGLRGVAWTQLVQQLAPTLLILPAAFKHLDRRHIGFTDAATVRSFLRYAWKVQLSSIMDVVGSQGDIVLVGRYAHAQTAAFGAGSNFAQTLGNVPMNAYVPMQTAVGHHIGQVGEADVMAMRGAADKVGELQRVWTRAVVGWVAVGAPAAYFGITDWLKFDPIKNPDPSLSGKVSAIVLLSFGMLLLAQVQLLWANGLGHSDVPLVYGLTSTIVNLGLTVALIGHYGAMGSVTATAAGRLVSAGVLAALMARRLPVRITSPWRQAPWPAAIVAAGVSLLGVWAMSRFVIMPVLGHGAQSLFLCGLAAAPGLAVYLLMVFGVQGSKELLGRVRNRGA